MCSFCNTTYYGESEKQFLVRASEHLGMAPLTEKWAKNLKKTAIIDHILLNGYNARFADLTILLKESNKFELHLKKYLLIKGEKLKFNRNIYNYPLDLFRLLFLEWEFIYMI